MSQLTRIAPARAALALATALCIGACSVAVGGPFAAARLLRRGDEKVAEAEGKQEGGEKKKPEDGGAQAEPVAGGLGMARFKKGGKKAIATVVRFDAMRESCGTSATSFVSIFPRIEFWLAVCGEPQMCGPGNGNSCVLAKIVARSRIFGLAARETNGF